MYLSEVQFYTGEVSYAGCGRFFYYATSINKTDHLTLFLFPTTALYNLPLTYCYKAEQKTSFIPRFKIHMAIFLCHTFAF